MRIGEIAAAAEVTITTLRFYERRGLLSPPSRRASGYRDYADAAVERVRFIKEAQALGFSLDEVAQLLRLREQPHDNSAEARTLSQTRLQTIEDKIRRLSAMRDELLQVMQACDCQTGATACTFLIADAASLNSSNKLVNLKGRKKK